MSRHTRQSRRTFLTGAATAIAGAATPAMAVCAQPQRAATPGLTAFVRSIHGAVLLPADTGFDRARRVVSHNPYTDSYPAMIVRCADVADVQRCIGFAREQGLEIAVRGGGHDVDGQSTTAGGLLIDMGAMRQVQFDNQHMTVQVGAGVRAGGLNDALDPHGLVVPLGCHPGVGIAGLTLGGGLGWLLGQFGATCDNVRAFKVVTADGQHVRATAEDHPGLFWALRGGGGNFGVVTSIEYHTHSLDGVVRGFVVYSARQLEGFLHFYHEFMSAAPDELTAEVTLLTAREPIIALTFCYCGSESAAASSVAPLLRFGPPVAAHVATVPYARLTDIPPAFAREVFGPPYAASQSHGGGFNYWQGASLPGWPDAVTAIFRAAMEEAPPGYSIGIGHFMHGRICGVADTATPIVRRAGSCSCFFNAGWGAPQHAAAAMGWVDGCMSRLAPHAVPTYVNYLSAGDPRSVADTYGDNYSRLRQIKSRYDPDNVFHLNRNVLPA